jgi:MOSC domain-containing protein YiiM
VQATISGRDALQARPHSLGDRATIAILKGWLRENVATTRTGLVYAYAFDDEISTGVIRTLCHTRRHRSKDWMDEGSVRAAKH